MEIVTHNKEYHFPRLGSKVLVQNFKSSLPSIEEIEKELHYEK